ncbi:MerR family DNA-binding protein [Gilvimarinus sp. SDUM040013]|uniref:MerR family DNA-binding protein n=1 Tax=Gilvimarinus gilvus TaxID=3058038 RepID=A0ABU4S2V6_9GAMM|nr:MerR family DNA-binding protein [Gilvimarinus sp. SDUM040013]MDO3384831.1 MerR family DNA-binding protein [Gilvimarinus sp. SDUM040013]MDX6850836.1 MerR family DNA-binding protein [Gilvimarinus sp. SDUM040013]
MSSTRQPTAKLELAVVAVASRYQHYTLRISRPDSLWRTGVHQRRYQRRVLRVAAMIKVAQSTSIDLGAISDALAELPEHSMPALKDWQRLSSHWRSSLQSRIDTLLALCDQLDSCIGCGPLSPTDAPCAPQRMRGEPQLLPN